MAAPLHMQLTVLGESQLSRAITRFTEGVTNLSPAFRQIIGLFQQSSKRQFDDEGSGPSGSWPALSQVYARWKATRYPGAPLMVRTGTLKDSLTGKTGKTIQVVKPMELRMGTKVKYGVFHQSRAARKALPRRAIIDITDGDRRSWAKHIQAQLVAVSRREWA